MAARNVGRLADQTRRTTDHRQHVRRRVNMALQIRLCVVGWYRSTARTEEQCTCLAPHAGFRQRPDVAQHHGAAPALLRDAQRQLASRQPDALSDTHDARARSGSTWVVHVWPTPYLRKLRVTTRCPLNDAIRSVIDTRTAGHALSLKVWCCCAVRGFQRLHSDDIALCICKQSL